VVDSFYPIFYFLGLLLSWQPRIELTTHMDALTHILAQQSPLPPRDIAASVDTISAGVYARDWMVYRRALPRGLGRKRGREEAQCEEKGITMDREKVRMREGNEEAEEREDGIQHQEREENSSVHINKEMKHDGNNEEQPTQDVKDKQTSNTMEVDKLTDIKTEAVNKQPDPQIPKWTTTMIIMNWQHIIKNLDKQQREALKPVYEELLSQQDVKPKQEKVLRTGETPTNVDREESGEMKGDSALQIDIKDESGTKLKDAAGVPGATDAERQDADFRPSNKGQAAREEEREGIIQVHLVVNDNERQNMILLTGLKAIFQKQLPKMPTEYISRLVYDR